MAVLVEKALDGRISKKGAADLLKALWHKFWNGGLENHKEKVVLYAYTVFDFRHNSLREKRNECIKRELERQRVRTAII